jgi:hypothetical protein
MVGFGGDDIERQLDMNGPRAAAVEHRESARQHMRQFVRPQQRMAEGRQALHQAALRRQLVQPALAESEIPRVVHAGEHENGDGVGIGLAKRRRDEAGRRPAAGAGVAVGHEARPLLVPRRDMPELRVGQAAIEFDGVDTGNAEDRIDAVQAEQLDQHLAARRHDCLPSRTMPQLR